MIHIIENVVNISLQEYIKEQFCSINFPWFYVDDIVQNNSGSVIGGFFNPIVQQHSPSAPQVDLCMSILFTALESVNIGFESVDRIRAGMFTKEHSNIIHSPHIDIPIPHLAMLYYILDSDGPTYFYDNNKNIIKQVNPKQGTAVIFDGLTLHSSSSPCLYNRRLVLNYNFNLQAQNNN
jgi:hypothetical protein